MKISEKFKEGDEVLVVNYPDIDVIGHTGTIIEFDGLYWNVGLDEDVGRDGDSRYLFEPEEIELINRFYKYNPDQAGDTEDDV